MFAFSGEMRVCWVWKESVLISRTYYLYLMKIMIHESIQSLVCMQVSYSSSKVYIWAANEPDPFLPRAEKAESKLTFHCETKLHVPCECSSYFLLVVAKFFMQGERVSLRLVRCKAKCSTIEQTPDSFREFWLVWWFLLVWIEGKWNSHFFSSLELWG